jgi:hypothetical protein
MESGILRLGLVLLVAVLVASGWEVFWDILRSGFSSQTGETSLRAHFLAIPLWVLFLIGLVMRSGRWLQGRDRESTRRRASQEERARVAPRRMAEDVPVHHRPRPVRDPDPSLPWEEEG